MLKLAAKATTAVATGKRCVCVCKQACKYILRVNQVGSASERQHDSLGDSRACYRDAGASLSPCNASRQNSSPARGASHFHSKNCCLQGTGSQ